MTRFVDYSSLAAGSYLGYSFNATSPGVGVMTLYTMMTAASYPSFTPITVAAIAEAVVQAEYTVLGSIL